MAENILHDSQESLYSQSSQESLYSQSSQEDISQDISQDTSRDISQDASKENVEIYHFTSKRGKPKVSMLGYGYTLNKENNGRMYWRCEDRQCKGTAITCNDILISSKEHQHAPDPTKVKVLFFKCRVKYKKYIYI